MRTSWLRGFVIVVLAALPFASLPAAAASAPRVTKPELGLLAYIATEAAQIHAAQARSGTTTVPVPQFVTELSKPVTVGGTLMALVAFTVRWNQPGGPVQVLAYRHQKWKQVTTLPPPMGAGAPPGIIFLEPNSSIAVGHVRGDPNPAFLIALSAADNTPGAVVTKVRKSWRYATFVAPLSVDQVIGRNPRFAEHTVVSYNDNCEPSCATGAMSTVVWHYHAELGQFESS